jgi:hypothetical protein
MPRKIPKFEMAWTRQDFLYNSAPTEPVSIAKIQLKDSALRNADRQADIHGLSLLQRYGSSNDMIEPISLALKVFHESLELVDFK